MVDDTGRIKCYKYRTGCNNATNHALTDDRIGRLTLYHEVRHSHKRRNGTKTDRKQRSSGPRRKFVERSSEAPQKAVFAVGARGEGVNLKTIKTNDMATIFSRIIAGEIPSYKVAEDDNYYAFLDINPLAKGHTLVVPKKEVDYIFDLDDDTLAGMTVFAKKVAHKIKGQIECKKVAMVVLGLEVPHAHIHLIPMNNENDVDFKREKLNLTPEEFAEIASKLSE